MKVRAAGLLAVVCVCLCGQAAQGAQAADPAALIAAAEKANASGDKIAALKGYMEAAGALRASGASQAKLDACAAQKDRLTLDLLGKIAEMQKQQAEVIQLQRGISQRVVRISQTDEDIQARTRKNEDRIRDIEALLLDALK